MWISMSVIYEKIYEIELYFTHAELEAPEKYWIVRIHLQNLLMISNTELAVPPEHAFI